jgi:hypothetical protein
MRQLFWTALIATCSCCAAAQTFNVVQNQPQAVTESPNATKDKKPSGKNATTTVDASGTTGDQMKKARKSEPATSAKTPRKSTAGSTAHTETRNNTAGSIAGNANVVGGTTRQAKPTRRNKQQTPPAGAQTAKTQPPVPAPNTKPEPKTAPKPATMSGPATPPYHAPAWLPQSPDSNTLRTQLESALTQDESLVGSKVDVAVDDNEINLAGTVPGSREKLAAERIARSFAGNRKVVNKLTVGAQASQPAQSAPQIPPTQKLNNHQPVANMPAASFAPQTETKRPANAPPSSAQTPQKVPATAGDQSPSPRAN